MAREFIGYEIDEGVARVTLNRPDLLNSFNGAMAGELQAVLDACAATAAVRSVLLTGAGRAFCAGQDLAEVMPPDGSQGAAVGDLVERSYNPIVLKLRALEKPVVCAVNGAAAGAGANIALACDLVLASTKAYFLQAFIHIGLVPDCGGTFFLPRLAGLARATAMAFLGERVSAEQALAWGMIYAVHEPEALMAAAVALSKRLATMPTAAIGLTKRAFNRALSSDLEPTLALERQLQDVAANSADYREGVLAFQQKRPPRFVGR